MKRVKKLFTMLLATLVILAGVQVTPQNRTRFDIPKVENVSVLGYVSDPWPGYNIGYAPYFYDANVVKIQQRLNSLYDDTYCGTPDGYFGNATLQAVKNFQWHAEITQDGVVGQITWNKLFYVY